MSFPSGAQFEHLLLAGQRTAAGELRLSEPHAAVEKMQALIDDDQLLLVGSSVLDIASSPELIQAIGDHEYYRGNIFIGGTNRVGGGISLYGVVVEDADVRGDGIMTGGHINGYLHLLNHMPDLSRIRAADNSVFTIDNERHSVHVNNRDTRLTTSEFNLLRMIVKVPGAVVPYSKLEEELGWTRDGVATHMSTLRTKLKRTGVANPILTARNRGVYFS